MMGRGLGLVDADCLGGGMMSGLVVIGYSPSWSMAMGVLMESTFLIIIRDARALVPLSVVAEYRMACSDISSCLLELLTVFLERS